MSILNIKGKQKFHHDDIAGYLKKIKEGDSSARENFVDEHKSLILKIVSQTLGKSALPQNSKEFEIGLSAFNYAVDNFDLNGKDSFSAYSEHIIKEWITDYLRNNPDSFSSSSLTDGKKDYLHFDSEDKEEISLIKLKLWEYGITLKDVALASPNDDDLIRDALITAKTLSDNKELYEKLTAKKDIPYDNLDERTKIQKKHIEKYRKYIILLSLIFKSELKVLNSYLKNIETGNEFSENVGIIMELYKNEALVFTFQGRLNIIKIKNISNLYIGKQIQLYKYGIKSSSNKRIVYYSLISLAAFVVLTAVPVCIYKYVTDDKKHNTVSEVYSTANVYPTADVSPTIEAVIPSNTEVPADITEEPAVAPDPTQIPVEPVSTSTPKPRRDNTSRPSHNTAVRNQPTKPPAVPSKNGNVPSATPIHLRASGIPGKPDISSDIYTVRVGQKYTVTMNMYQGNNATSLILYENDEVLAVKQLKDNTPYAQSGSVSITAKYEGMYKYKCEIANDFGTVSSSSIWINIVAN